jgi:hypothetical protein
MKTFYFIIFIIVLFGGAIFIALLPFLIRDWIRNSKVKRRQSKFQESLEMMPSDAEEKIFEITVRLYKEDVAKINLLDHRSRYSWFSKIILTFLFGCWLVGGSLGIWKMFIGENPHGFWRWAHSMFGILIGLRMLTNIWISGWLMNRKLQKTSDFEISQVTETDYVINKHFISILIQGNQVAQIGWEDICFVKSEDKALCIVTKSYGFFWIPKDSQFRSGDWDGLNAFLKPLIKT